MLGLLLFFGKFFSFLLVLALLLLSVTIGVIGLNYGLSGSVRHLYIPPADV